MWGNTVITVDAGGTRYNVSHDDADFWRQVSDGTWEPATFSAIGPHLSPETVFLDFGTWIGPITLFAAAKAKRVISFEPDPEALRRLTANIALNPDLARKITVVSKAIWPSERTLKMGARTAPGDSMSSIVHTAADVTWDVETITPEQVAAMLPADAPLFIKIDVEGAEYDIVPSLAPLLNRRDCAVLISFHPRFAFGSGFRMQRSFPATKRIFDMFKGWQFSRVRRDSIKRAKGMEFLTRLPFGCFEARQSYLFVRNRSGQV